jgi:AbiV family abortive infection protein
VGKDLDLGELIRWAEATFANAEDLFFEAGTLREAGHLSRALFLHQISMEECGKVELLGDWIANVLSGLHHDTGRLWRELASHEAKNLANAYMLELSEEEKHAPWANSCPATRRVAGAVSARPGTHLPKSSKLSTRQLTPLSPIQK